MNVISVRKIVYLGQYVENLGVHQSSSVSVLGYTKNLSTDLKMKKHERLNETSQHDLQLCGVLWFENVWGFFN